jgi:dihydropteroate synthase
MTMLDSLLSRRRPVIMGIVNVTPDSFSDGGRFVDPTRAVEHAIALADEGADIVDVGGESTRPPGGTYGEGARGVDEQEELARVLPVIEEIHARRPSLPISIDTMKPAVAERAIAAGASLINDVSAGRYDERIMRVAAERDVPYVLMHGHDPADRRAVDEFRYDDVVAEVFAFLEERIARARAHGVRTIVADVGIGFAKGATDNVALLRGHGAFLALGVPLLVGASRKAFIGRLLGGAAPTERVVGTLAAHAAAVLGGASIVRVHDVAAAQQFFTVFDALVPELPTR